MIKTIFKKIQNKLSKASKGKIKQANLPSIDRRRNFIRKYMETSSKKILEIGAFNDPTFEKTNTDIYYMDWFSKEELYEKYKQSNPERVENIVPVDYVVKKKNFEASIDTKFDLIIANHVVEHIPDLISWFQSAESLLNKKGGLFLSVPDKEYTFDKLRPLTSLGQLIENKDLNLSRPSFKHVFDCIYLHRPIRSTHIWENTYQDLLGKKRFSAKEAVRRTKNELAEKDYVDVHCNVFDYTSFLDICYDLNNIGHLELTVKGSKDVEHPGNEFYVFFTK